MKEERPLSQNDSPLLLWRWLFNMMIQSLHLDGLTQYMIHIIIKLSVHWPLKSCRQKSAYVIFLHLFIQIHPLSNEQHKDTAWMEKHMNSGYKTDQIQRTILNTYWAIRTVQGAETMNSARDKQLYIRNNSQTAWKLSLELSKCTLSVLSCQFSSVCMLDCYRDDFVRIHWACYTEMLGAQTICNEAECCSSLFQAQNKDLQSDATV